MKGITGISPDGRRYLVKYAEAHTHVNNLDTSYVNNVISEYLISGNYDLHAFERLEHETDSSN